MVAYCDTEYPAQLIQFVTDEAARDADEVAAFLAAAGLAPPPGETRGFPPGVLLDLGAVVRLRRWEAAGHTVHLDAGLPTTRAALDQLIDALVEVATNPTAPRATGALGRAVFDAAVGSRGRRGPSWAQTSRWTRPTKTRSSKRWRGSCGRTATPTPRANRERRS